MNQTLNREIEVGAVTSDVTSTANESRSLKMKNNANARKSGINTARSLLKQWGTLALDGRLPLARERNAWLADVIADAGGRENLSRAEISLREALADEWLILRSIGLHIFTMPSLVNRKRRSLHPIVMQYNQLSDSFHRRCHQLGIKRVPPPKPTLADYLAQRGQRPTETHPASSTREQTQPSPTTQPAPRSPAVRPVVVADPAVPSEVAATPMPNETGVGEIPELASGPAAPGSWRARLEVRRREERS